MVLSQPRSRWDGDPKKRLIDFQNRGVATIVFMENYGKPKKTRIRLVYEKPDCESGSRLRVGKVLAPHSARPKTVPLIE